MVACRQQAIRPRAQHTIVPYEIGNVVVRIGSDRGGRRSMNGALTVNNRRNVRS